MIRDCLQEKASKQRLMTKIKKHPFLIIETDVFYCEGEG